MQFFTKSFLAFLCAGIISASAAENKSSATSTNVAGPNPPEEKKADTSDLFADNVIKGYELENKGKYHEAIEAFTLALKYQEESPIALIRRGVCYAKVNENERASADLHAAIGLQPRTVSDFYELAWLRGTSPIPRFRDGTLAVTYAQRSLREGEAIERYDALAAGYAEMGNFRLATEVVQKGVKFFPNSPRVPDMLKRLQLYKEKKKYREEWGEVGKNP